MSEQNQGEKYLEYPDHFEPHFPSHSKTLSRAIVKHIRKAFGAKIPREELYSVSATPFEEYDETFRSDSVKEVVEWARKYPTNRPAIGDLGGYGTVPAGIVEAVRKQGVNAYGLALAYEKPPELATPHATLLQGDLGELAINKDGSSTLRSLQEQLTQANCSLGFAKLFCRPVVGYNEMEKQRDIAPSDISQFYLDMFTTITKNLLAPDGIFDMQVPLHIPDKGVFRESLQKSLGSNYVLLPLQRSPYQRLWVEDKPRNPRLFLTTMRIIRSDLP